MWSKRGGGEGPASEPTDGFSLSPGATLGRYQIVAPLGRGSTCEVYRAVHLGLHKTVAVKVLRKEWLSRPAALVRFQREGKVAVRFSHPNAVQMLDVGHDRGVPFLVMEFLEGESLESYLNRKGSLSSTHAVDLLLPVLSALSEGHASHVVHRDVKPGNLFLARDKLGRVEPKLLDFGISRPVRATEAENAAPEILGTPQYMAPEQARGERDIDARADQYALGVILYEMLSGVCPHELKSESETILQLVHRVAYDDRVESLKDLNPGLPPGLSAVVMRALAHERNERFADIPSFARALLPFASPAAARTWSRAFSAAEAGAAAERASTPRESAITMASAGDGGLSRRLWLTALALSLVAGAGFGLRGYLGLGAGRPPVPVGTTTGRNGTPSPGRDREGDEPRDVGSGAGPSAASVPAPGRAPDTELTAGRTTSAAAAGREARPPHGEAHGEPRRAHEADRERAYQGRAYQGRARRRRRQGATEELGPLPRATPAAPSTARPNADAAGADEDRWQPAEPDIRDPWRP